ncbi:MAG: hypothetical protein D6B28_07310 [Gammaproteobacteria bacterium]|nr:MAG: hypothetical protein D6B28_07310 [Gammaproteobacteria bacterium]
MFLRTALLILSLFLSLTAQAANIYTYTANITGHENNTDQALIDYYQNQYGIGTGSVIDFDIAYFLDREGYETDENGSIFTYTDQEDFQGDRDIIYNYFYAELVDISIDEQLLNYGQRQYNYAEDYILDVHSDAGYLDAYSLSTHVGNHLELFWGKDRSGTSTFFKMSINDGTGEATFQGDYKISNIETPVPAAAWLFLSGIGGCCIFRRTKK